MRHSKHLPLGFFPYGTQYHRAPTPTPDEWAVDLPRVKAQGYTHVQFRPQWRCHETKRGRPAFDDLDRLFDLAEKNDLRVILKPMLETAPDWVYTELDGRRIGFHGVPLSPSAGGAFYAGGFLPCFDKPAVAKAAAEFSKALCARYRERPSLWVVDAWNEPRARPLGHCQCPESRESYRRWLRDRFGDVETLNRLFGKYWTSLDSVFPPEGAGDYAEMFLWRQWAAQAVADQVGDLVRVIREALPDHPVFFHRGACDVVTDPAADAGDDLANVATDIDWYGLSCRMWQYFGTRWDTCWAEGHVAVQCDWLRRCDPNYWVQEFYPCHANWERKPSIDYFERQLFQALAHGAKGLTWWQYRSERVGNEENGYGLVEINGAENERSVLAARVGRMLERHGAALVASEVPRGQLALLYSKPSDLISRIRLMGNGWGRFFNENNNIETFYKAAIHSAHSQHWAHNIERDFVAPGDDLDGYEIVHVTAAEVVDEDTARRLKTFVERGGRLWIEYPFACRDDNTWVAPDRPTRGLDRLLGCREGARIAIDGRARDAVDWPGAGPVAAVGYRVDLEIDDAETIARWEDGAPAAAIRRQGEGLVLTTGINLSRQFHHDDGTPAAVAALRDVYGRLGAKPILDWDHARRVTATRRVGTDSEIWFVTNLSKNASRTTLPRPILRSWWRPEAVAEEALVCLGAGEVWVGEIRREI